MVCRRLRNAAVAALTAVVALTAPGAAWSQPGPQDSSGCKWTGYPPRYRCPEGWQAPQSFPTPSNRTDPQRRMYSPEQSESTESGHLVRVVRVQDGDTIHVKMLGKTEKVRYIGVSAPDQTHPEWNDADLIHAARLVNMKLVLGKRAVLEFDGERRDGLGRLLAYVWVDDVLINAEMIRLGYAKVIESPNAKHQVMLDRMQREAKAQRRGFWGRIENDAAIVKKPVPQPPVDAVGTPKDPASTTATPPRRAPETKTVPSGDL
jgi:micrococcal nuclease